MLWNPHSELEGRHAFLSPSKYHWINYNEDKIAATFASALASMRGTELHLFAHKAIDLGIRLPEDPITTLSLYVNDAIGYRMTTEQHLYYSDNAFGSADTICFRNNKLRIHDLKTGKTPTSEHQLEIYAALFCLEYRFKPHEIEIELRIYQNNEVRIYEVDPDTIVHIMDKITTYDKIIQAMRLEALS